MPADVYIQRHTGMARSLPLIGSTTTRITTSNRLACSDSPADGTSNPIPVPTLGTNYSWWVTVQFAIGSAGGYITNLQFYTSGLSLPDGVVCAVATSKQNIGYTQAVGTTTSGNVLNTTSYPGLNTPPVDVTKYTASAPLKITGTCQAGVGHVGFGDFVVYQFAVPSGSTTEFGPIDPTSFYFSYDEI